MSDDAVLARLDQLETANQELAGRLAAVEAENRGLRAGAVATPPAPAGPVEAPAASDDPVPASVGRRQALRKGLAVAGAAAAGAVLLDSTPAAAANGQPMVLGATNTATSSTILNGAPFYASMYSGVAVYGLSTYGVGAYLQGGVANLWFATTTTRTPPTNDGFAHQQGEVVHDKFGFLWLCVEGGNPGTWRSLSGNGAAGSFYPFPTPQRTYDSRPGTTPSQGPKTKLAAGTTRTLSLANIGATGSIPTNAVMLSILLVNAAAGNGNFTVWEAGQAVPQSNTLVWGGSAGRFSTMAFTTLDEAGRINVRANLATDLVIDVVGLYR